MRCLYLWVLGKPILDQDECNKILSKYFPKNDCGEYTFTLRMVPQGWFQCGSWFDKPKGAQYVTHHHGTFYWVAPGREEELTKLNLAMLRIALEAGRTKSVVRYYYDDKQNLVQQETTVEGAERVKPFKKRRTLRNRYLLSRKASSRRY